MIVRGSFVAGLACMALAAASLALPEDVFTGTWTGVLDTPEPVRVALVIEPGRRAWVTSSLVGLEQDAATLTPSSLRIEGQAIRVGFRQISGVFEGRLTLPDRIDGVWRQAGSRTPVSLYRQGESAGLFPRGRPLDHRGVSCPASGPSAGAC
jgi:hypothetical protein